ncbi:unnamed protein product, partial [Gongylonema pulchrum]|uniref:CS domain-containing protein n=1 Tax=Gongylonema pulchrum TaxID=637853 RepID=A0A183EWC1_9BILA
MLTPVFSIEQTDEHIIIEIHAPYANVKDADADYADRQFYFSSKPYYLKLYLPGELDDAEPISGTYDCDKGSFTFIALKKNKGEFFPNLDLINELLKPSEVHAKRLVEEVGENDSDDSDSVTDILHEPQTSVAAEETDLMDEKCRLYGYGFACSRHG